MCRKFRPQQGVLRPQPAGCGRWLCRVPRDAFAPQPQPLDLRPSIHPCRRGSSRPWRDGARASAQGDPRGRIALFATATMRLADRVQVNHGFTLPFNARHRSARAPSPQRPRLPGALGSPQPSPQAVARMLVMCWSPWSRRRLPSRGTGQPRSRAGPTSWSRGHPSSSNCTLEVVRDHHRLRSDVPPHDRDGVTLFMGSSALSLVAEGPSLRILHPHSLSERQHARRVQYAAGHVASRQRTQRNPLPTSKASNATAPSIGVGVDCRAMVRLHRGVVLPQNDGSR